MSQITGHCASHGVNLLEVHQFTDQNTGWFFTRLAMDPSTMPRLRREFADSLRDLANSLSAEWDIVWHDRRPRVALLVSLAGHCLMDLLWRWKSQDIAMDLVGVISNHDDWRRSVEAEGLPFVHLPIHPSSRTQDFEKVSSSLLGWGAETVVLARYMQIIPPEMCSVYKGRMINIHHSFLPSFAGAHPYQQAYDRGVKLIGATCHYVTENLDEGPIIEQEVMRVEHHHTKTDLTRLGQDCERLALSRGLRYHLSSRVFVHEGKTVVFRD